MSLYQNWYDQFGQLSPVSVMASTGLFPVRLSFKTWPTAMAVAGEVSEYHPRVSKVGSRWEVLYYTTAYMMNGAA